MHDDRSRSWGHRRAGELIDGDGAFDEVSDGAHYGLAPEVATEIWARVRAETPDERVAMERFRVVAERVQRRGGWLTVGPGKITRVEAELYGRDPRRDVFADVAPGKRTRIEAEQRRERGGAASALPHFEEVMALQRATRVSGVANTRGARAAPSVSSASSSVASTTPGYVNAHGAAIHAAIAERILRVRLPEPHARLRWRDARAAGAGLAHLIGVSFEAARNEKLKRLMELTQPIDLFAVVDELRRVPGPPGWRPEIGIAVAAAFDEPITISLQRVGPRVRALLDVQTGMPSLSSVVANCLLDRVVGELLIDPKFVAVGAKQRRGSVDDTPGRTFEHGPRHVTYEWQGAREPGLWNWIRVESPPDAAVEEVAQIPFLGGDVTDSEQAYRIAASPPYFGIPFETAKRVPEAVRHAPIELQRPFRNGDPGPRFADRAVLARSAAADDAALAQAPKPRKGDLAVDHALDRIGTQLSFMEQQLAPWKAVKPLAPAGAFVARRRAELAADPRKAERWRAALAAQESILQQASSEVADMLRELAANGATPAGAAPLRPVVRVFEAYARAGGVSYLHAEAPAALADARRAASRLPLAFAEERVRVARGAIAAQRATEISAGTVESHSRDNDDAVASLTARGAEARLRATRNGEQDPEELDELAADADLATLRAQIVTLQTQLRAVENRADAVGLPETTYRNGLPTLHAFPAWLREESEGWFLHLDDKNVQFGPGAGSERARRTARKRRVMADVSSQLAKVEKLAGFGTADNYFTWAQKQIADKQLWDLIHGIAAQLAIMIATGQLVGAAFAALRGFAIGSNIVSGLRAASVALKAGEVATHAIVATSAQAALGGRAGPRELAENAVAIVLGHAAMRPFRGLLQHSSALEKEVLTFARAAARTGKLVAEGALESGTSIAAGAVARLTVQGGHASIANSEEWITNAIAFAANRFIGQRARQLHARLEAASRQRRASRELDGFAKDAGALAKAAASAHPSPDEALASFVKYHELLERLQLHFTADGDPSQTATAAELRAFSQNSVELLFRLAKLSPVVEGAAYEGTGANIQRAFDIAKQTGIELAPSFDAKTRTWHVKLDRRTVEVRERSGTNPSAIVTRTPPSSPHAIAQHLGTDVHPLGGNRFGAAATKLRDLHAAWKAKSGTDISTIHYDADTNRSHFEVSIETPRGRERARIETQLAARIDSFGQLDSFENRIIGKPIAAGKGHTILRALVNRDPAALKAAGIGGDARMPRETATEFGLGGLSDGRVVLILGEANAVDWSALPGITPLGHTHPSSKDNDLRAHRKTSKAEISVEELLATTKEPLVEREKIFPSAADFIVMARLGVDGHRVYTPYVIRDGKVMKPGAGESGSRLEFTIGKTRQIGALRNGEQVYQSRLTGRVEGGHAIDVDIWITQNADGSSGHLYMARPANIVSNPAPAAGQATKTATTLTPALTLLAEQHGERAVRWAQASLAEPDVQTLLKVLESATLAAIEDIPAVDARALVDLVTARRVNDALHLGPTGPIRGAQLEALRRQVAPSVLIDLLDASGKTAGRLSRLARVADKIEPASTLLGESSLSAGSITIDSNARIGIDELVRGVSGKTGQKIDAFSDLAPNYQDAINAIRRARGLGAYVDAPAGTRPTIDSIVGPGSDLRATQLTGAEAMVNEAPTRTSPTLTTMRGIRTDRAHPDYARVLSELKALEAGKGGVGGSKGAIDRSLIVDTMFAASTGGGVPKLVTADRGVCVGLARFARGPRDFRPTGDGGVSFWDQLIARFPEGRFTVEILGHQLEVYFHAEVHAPPYPP